MSPFRVRHAVEVSIARRDQDMVLRVVTSLAKGVCPSGEPSEAKHNLLADVEEHVARVGLDGFQINWSDSQLERWPE
jgi:hypothetical protein